METIELEEVECWQMAQDGRCSSNGSIQEQVANMALVKNAKIEAIHRVKGLSMSDGQSE